MYFFNSCSIIQPIDLALVLNSYNLYETISRHIFTIQSDAAMVKSDFFLNSNRFILEMNSQTPRFCENIVSHDIPSVKC